MNGIELLSPEGLPEAAGYSDQPLVRLAGLVRPEYLIEVEAVAAAAGG